MPTNNALKIGTEAETAGRSLDLKDRHGNRGPASHGIFSVPRTAPAVPEETQELTHLRKLLSAQDAARQTAQTKVMEVNRQLRLSETESNRVRIELRRSRDELVTTKQEHAFDLRKAAEREAGLWSELAEVRGQAAKAGDQATQYRRKFLAVSLILAVPAMLFAAAIYGHATAAPERAAVESHGAPFAGTPTPAAASEFSAGVGRLNQALDRFKNEKGEDVIRRVHEANARQGRSVCSFEWNNGEVSLVFGSDPGMGIGTSMAQCADAVEKAAK